MHINVHRCHMRVARDGKITVPTSQLGNFVNKIKLKLTSPQAPQLAATCLLILYYCYNTLHNLFLSYHKYMYHIVHHINQIH